MLKYVFTGDVPNDAVLPNASAEKGNTQVTAAAEPTSALKGYSFDGWYRSDNGAKVTPGQQFDMPNSDLTLKGKWTLDEMNVQKITVKYEYTDNNDGKHVPDGAPVLSPELTVKVGQTHYIQKISQDTDYHKFGGWEPALSVDGKKVVLTKQSDGSYQGDGYIIDIANGTLSTEQFREKQDVVVTFSGAWIPYKGTIQFDNNGGEGVMEAMQNVTWDTTTQLPLNSFTNLDNSFQFTGWAKGPSGNIVKLDGDTADKLIDADGKTVTLYAVWKRGSYGVGYDLENVTSSNTSDTVTLNGQYSTTLAPANGYTMDSVKVTMGGIVITSQVYNPTTGEVTIPKALGNIVIKASANPLAPVVEHTITVSVTNGTANPSGKVKVRDGQNQIIKFTPNAGYVLSSVTVNDKPASLTGDSYTFTNVTSDQNIDVVYKKSDGGSVTHRYPIEVIFTGDGNAVSDKKVAAAGEKVMITVNGHVENIKATDSNGNEVAVKLNSDGKYVFNMPGSAVTVTINFTKEDETSGAITPEDTGVADLLDTVTHRAYLTGYKTGEFRPNYNITRAEVAQMFYNLLLDQNVPVTVSFDDVPADAWYAEAVNTLASMDILAGVGDNNFAPSRPITRAEFTAIAMRFTKGSVQGENIFSDVKEEDWFYQQVIGSIKYGWIGGYADGTFRPNKTITRAEVTTIVNKMLGRSADRNFVSHHLLELKRFIDFGHTHWAYYNIVEATNTHEYVKNENGEVWTK